MSDHRIAAGETARRTGRGGIVLFRLARRLLAPAACASCDMPVGSAAAILCGGCAASVERSNESREPFAYALYGGAIATAIRRLKYERRPDLAEPLGHLLRHVCRLHGLRADWVVPVPLHFERLVERGYNQAALLAAHVARELRAPLDARLLVRTAPTAPQAELDRRSRLENLKGAISVRAAHRVQGRSILVIDDVATTGATLGACRRALVDAGALQVASLVVARAILAHTSDRAGESASGPGPPS